MSIDNISGHSTAERARHQTAPRTAAAATSGAALVQDFAKDLKGMMTQMTSGGGTAAAGATSQTASQQSRAGGHHAPHHRQSDGTSAGAIQIAVDQLSGNSGQTASGGHAAAHALRAYGKAQLPGGA